MFRLWIKFKSFAEKVRWETEFLGREEIRVNQMLN